MTVIAAFPFQGDMWVAADRATTVIGESIRIDHLNNRKLIVFPYGVIATTGARIFNQALRTFKSNNTRIVKSKFETELEVFEFFQEFYCFMKAEYGLSSYKNDTNSLGQNTFIVVTSKLIFEVCSDLSVMIYDRLFAMGSGGAHMLGGIHCLSQVLDDPREIIHRAYEVPIKFGYGCGGEVEIINVTQTLKDEALKEAALKEKKEKPPKNKKNKSVKKQKASAPLKMLASL